MALYQDIASYHPFNEQEAADRHVMLRALKTNAFVSIESHKLISRVLHG